jgi:hypothetical protein
MHTVPTASETDICPCLMPLVNDQLVMVPTRVFCRRSDGRIRLPARATLLTTCTSGAYRECAGYRATDAQA